MKQNYDQAWTHVKKKKKELNASLLFNIQLISSFVRLLANVWSAENIDVYLDM